MKCAILSKQSRLVLALVLVTALTGGHSLVSARDELHPTVAPLLSSTPKPTSAPKSESKPTKALMIINAPPMKQKHLVPLHVDSVEAQQQPLQLKSALKVPDSKPLQVTGFITKSGNIYEIEDKRGIGKIEARQADEPQEEQVVCNYGSVVVYSDVPCDQVTNVQVGGIHPVKPEQQVTDAPPADAAQQAADGDDSANDTADAGTNANTPRGQGNQRRRRRRPANGNRRRRVNGSNPIIRRRVHYRPGGGNGNGNGVRNGNANRRGQQQRRRRPGQRRGQGNGNGQRRPANRQQQQQRRRQQQQQQNRRRQQQQRRRRQQPQRRRQRIREDSDVQLMR